MIIMPIFIPHNTPKCPNCDKEENTKEVCRHCGYEYSDDGDKSKAWFSLICLLAAIAGGIWIAPEIAFGSTPNFIEYILGALLGGVGMALIIVLIGFIIWIFESIFSKN